MSKIHSCALLALAENRFLNTFKVLKLNAAIACNAFEHRVKKLFSQPALQSIDCRFDVDAHDEAGTCALSISTEEGNEEMIKLLLEYGAAPDMAHPYMEEDEE